MGGIIRIIFFCVLVYVFVKLFRKLQLFLQSNKGRYSATLFGGSRGRIVDEMVQDPVCKLYIPKRDAVTAVHSGTTYYFCSKGCLEKFTASE